MRGNGQHIEAFIVRTCLKWCMAVLMAAMRRRQIEYSALKEGQFVLIPLNSSGEEEDEGGELVLQNT